MGLKPKYLTLVPLKESQLGKVEPFKEAGAKEKEAGTANPIFNFDQSFINNLQSISSLEMGQSVPYVRLRTINHSTGKIINDLSVEFFHKTLDMDTVKDSTRFSDRPAMSLKELTITTDQASGYLYYTNVSLRLKLHNPEKLQDNTLLSFLVPGAPLLLEYGWNSPNEFLNRKSNLLWQVKTYSLNFDQTGQVDVHVEGMAFNETFNTIYVGDDGKPLEVKKKPGESKIEGKEAGGEAKSDVANPEELQFFGLNMMTKRLEALSEFLEKNKKNRQKVPDYRQLKRQYEVLQKTELRQRGLLQKKFTQQMAKLPEPHTVKKWGKDVPCWTFHDIVYGLCNSTFENMTSVFHPSTEKTREDPDIKTTPEFRIIYGKFGPYAGAWAKKPIGDFPIHKKRFNSLLKKQRKNGLFVPMVGGLLNMLVGNFFENPEYHKSLLSKKDRELHKKPDIVINVTNRGNVIEVQIIDANQDFPLTSSMLTKNNTKPNDIIKEVLKEGKLPIIFLGSAGSFIKNLSMSQISDQYMKAVLIERMNRDRINSVRSTRVQSQDTGETTVTPLTLPLRGTMNVLGHVDWKPFRAFFLSAGVYVIDGVYKILKVSHKLSAEGFNTNIEFMYH